MEKIVLIIEENSKRFWLEVEEYSTELYSSAETTDEWLKEYENINMQILRISVFTTTVQQIYVDLPGFINRSFLDNEI